MVLQGLAKALRQEVSGAAAVVAHGRAAGLLLGQQLSPAPTAAVLIGPAFTAAARQQLDPGWRLVPKLVVVTEKGAAMDGCARQAMDATNAWCLRADLAGSAGDEDFARQVTSLTVKFALEQAAFELAGRANAQENE